jgi:hypothetical protein
MLHIITDLNDPLLDLVKDDPVRPEIPSAARVVQDRAEIFVLVNDHGSGAVTCVRYTNQVPKNVPELDDNLEATVAVFYTIWSYQPGCGQRLIRAAQQHILTHRPNITRFVTLSPKTEMARKFHHRNGAATLRENETSINYEYQAGAAI